MRYTYADEDGGDDFSRNEIAVTVETRIGKQSDFFTSLNKPNLTQPTTARRSTAPAFHEEPER